MRSDLPADDTYETYHDLTDKPVTTKNPVILTIDDGTGQVHEVALAPITLLLDMGMAILTYHEHPETIDIPAVFGEAFDGDRPLLN